MSRARRLLFKVLIAGLVAYALVLLAAFFGQRSLLYFPNPDRPDLANASLGPQVREACLPTEDGLELLAWYAAPADAHKPVILYFHGNAGNIGDRSWTIPPFLAAGYGVLLVEYRGYGGNSGSPTEDGLYRDGRAAMRFLNRNGIGHNRIAVFGESLGTGVAVEIATEFKLGAVGLVSPYTSIADVAAIHYPYLLPQLLTRDRFDSLKKIGGLDTPLLVVHGGQDGLIPIGLARRLFDAASEPKTWVSIPDAGHNNIHMDAIAAGYVEFIGKAGLGSNAAAAATPVTAADECALGR